MHDYINLSSKLDSSSYWTIYQIWWFLGDDFPISILFILGDNLSQLARKNCKKCSQLSI